jgi:hypothetical protein
MRKLEELCSQPLLPTNPEESKELQNVVAVVLEDLEQEGSPLPVCLPKRPS